MDFSTLSDLVKIINKNKVKDATTLKDLGGMGKNLTKLYQGLLNDAYKDDDEAAKDLYGKNASDSSYKRTRLKLFNLLVNTAFFMDTNQAKFTDIDRALGECYKGFAAAQLLFRYGGRNSGIYLLKNVLEQAMKYEISFLVIEILRVLKQHYIWGYSNSAEIKKTTSLLNSFEDRYALEVEARRFMENLQEGFVAGRIGRNVIEDSVEEQYLRLKSQIPTVNTSNYIYVTYVVGVIFYLSRNNMPKVFEICNEGLDRLRNRKTIQRGQLAVLATNQLTCFAHFKDFENPNIEKSIHYCYSLSTEGTHNWFKINEIVVHLYIYAERYADALELYQKSVKHPRFLGVPDGYREPWRIFAGYFHLLAHLGAIDNDLVMKKVGPIKIDEFEYDFNLLNTVKYGMNIPVLMLPVFFKALEEGALDDYGRSIESLRKYVDRHLRKRGMMRSVAMIDLLKALDKYPIQPRASKNAISKHLKVFVDAPVELSEQSSAIEIVPYEKLWSLLLRYRRVYL
jgi:hypothetical protein